MKLKIEEIKLLSGEVRENINQTLDITKFAITAASVILGFGLSAQAKMGFLSPLISLLTLPILIAAVEMIIDRRRNVMKKATFLRRYGGELYYWELFLREQRRINETKKSKNHSFTKTLFIMLSSMIGISIGASFLIYAYIYYYIKSDEHISLIDSNLILGILICTTIFILVYFNFKWKSIGKVIMGSKEEDNMFLKWEQVEKELRKSAIVARSPRKFSPSSRRTQRMKRTGGEEGTIFPGGARSRRTDF